MKAVCASPRPALAALLLALAGALLPLPIATAAPNTTDLAFFAGKYTGTTKLQTRSSLFRGKSKIRVNLTSPVSAKIKINASIKADSRNIATNNEIVFAPNGVVRGKELAPGDTSGSGFKGTYTATADVLTFSGKFQVRSTKGTFSGTVTKRSNGKLILTYSVLPDGAEGPIYVYTYDGK